MSRPEVEFYDMRQYSPWLLEKIERNGEWAIVYDMEDDRWDVYVNGEHRTRCHTQREAARIMAQFVNGELE
jgi:hypothetical protein